MVVERTALTEAFDAYVERQYQKHELLFPRVPTFRASEMGFCRRASVLRRAGFVGRPITMEKKRFFYFRTTLHDHFLQGLRSQGRALVREVDISPGLPMDFSGHLDAICHAADCECGLGGIGNMGIQWGRMVRLRKSGDDEEWQEIAASLVRHKYRLVDVKTTHPNLVNYSHKLPKAHNILQVQTYTRGFRQMFSPFDWQMTLGLVYIPMGEGRILDCEVEDDPLAVSREMTALRQGYDDFKNAGQLPPVLPLAVTDKKEGQNRVLFYTTPWQCSEQYCAYCRWGEGDECCEPSAPQVASGDRFAYTTPEGDTVWVKKWLDKLGQEAPVGAEVVDNPPPRKEAA